MSTTTVLPEVRPSEVPVHQTTQTAEQREQKKTKNIFETAHMLEINRTWPRITKQFSSDLISVAGETELSKTDKTKISASKKLFDFPELRRVASFDAEVDSFLNRHCVPFPLRRSMHLVPAPSFNEVEAFLMDHLSRMPAFIEQAANAYDRAVNDAKAFLGPLFHQSDYLSKEAFARCFTFRWTYWQMGVSDLLKEANKDVAAREAEKIEADIRDASEAAQQMLRQAMADLVSGMVDRLTPDSETGRKKTFKDSSIKNVQEFLDEFSKRNLTEDDALETLVNQAKALVNGVAPATIRDNEGLRTSLQLGFAQIKEKLDTMIQVAPIRMVRLVD